MSPGFQITSFIIAIIAIILSSLALIFCIMTQQDLNNSESCIQNTENAIVALTPTDE